MVALLVTSLLLTGAPVRSPDLGWRLEYTVASGARGCPNVEEFAELVAARLGHSPFRADGHRAAVVRIGTREELLEGEVSLRDHRGAPSGQRSFRVPAGNCHGLAESLSLGIALAFDPLLVPRTPLVPRAGLPASPALASSSPDETALVCPPPAFSTTPDWNRSASVGLRAASGALPGMTFGPFASFSFGREKWRAELGGELYPSATRNLRVGQLIGSSLLGTLGLCARLRDWSFCFRGAGGALRVAGSGLRQNHRDVLPFVAAGAQVAYDLSLSAELFLRLAAEGDANIVRSGFLIDGVELWRTPPAGVATALSLGVRLP